MYFKMLFHFIQEYKDTGVRIKLNNNFRIHNFKWYLQVTPQRHSVTVGLDTAWPTQIPTFRIRSILNKPL